MIVEGILNLLKTVIFALFSWINIPSVNDTFTEISDSFSFLISAFVESLSIINLFLPWDIVRFGFPILIIVMNFEHIYYFVMWVIKKIPMLGIK